MNISIVVQQLHQKHDYDDDDDVRFLHLVLVNQFFNGFLM